MVYANVILVILVIRVRRDFVVQSVCTATASRVTCVSVTRTTTVITVMFLSVMGGARVMVMESVMLTTLVPAIKDMKVSFALFNYALRTVKDVEHV